MTRPTLPNSNPNVGDVGHTNDHATIVDALQALYDEKLSGTFDPEGIVSAPVGTVYANTASGQMWSKKTGSGATGWQQLGAGTDIVHGNLQNLEVDDHPQYYNQTRGDARYSKRVYVGPAADNPDFTLYDFWVVTP